MLTYGTECPKFTERFPIPGINLNGRFGPLQTLVTLDATSMPTGFAEWPDFHDGVAASLQIDSQANDVLGSSWIVYNNPEVMDASHAGFLFGLGLTGQLKQMVRWHAFNYLTMKHDITSIGLLLGLAASHCGTMNETIAMLLYVHIPALLPPNATELRLSSLTQTASVMGIGLLFCDSANRRMTEVLLGEISRCEGDLSAESAALRETYSLAAGFALGFVTLGKGADAPNLASVSLADRLDCLINVRKATAAGARPDLHSGRAGVPDTMRHARDPPCFFQRSGCDGKIKNNDTAGQSTIPDDMQEVFRSNVIAPSALIALALTFLQTDNASVATKLALPLSEYLLSQEKPSFLFLRVVGHSLVMWSCIRADTTWIESQVPRFLRDQAARIMHRRFGYQMPRVFDRASQADVSQYRAESAATPASDVHYDASKEQAIQLEYFNIISGACLAVALKNAGSCNSTIGALLCGHLARFMEWSKVSGKCVDCGWREEKRLKEA